MKIGVLSIDKSFRMSYLYIKKTMFEPKRDDVENYFNAEYWRLKYFSVKGNYGQIIILESLVLLSLLLKSCIQ